MGIPRQLLCQSLAGDWYRNLISPTQEACTMYGTPLVNFDVVRDLDH